jgi:hypothetical protein
MMHVRFWGAMLPGHSGLNGQGFTPIPEVGIFRFGPTLATWVPGHRLNNWLPRRPPECQTPMPVSTRWRKLDLRSWLR